MKISIITVSFNEERNISRTIESVLNQSSSDFEYIICDGKSNDNTVKIAKSYRNQFIAKGVKYVVNSEKDNGVYDGMNTGIDIATGDYIYFLNAGDWFYSEDVIEKITSEVARNNLVPDVIYGHIALVERNVFNILKGEIDTPYEVMGIYHQAVFVSSTIIKQCKFNTKYKVSADFDLILKLRLNKASFFKVDVVIAYFSAGGISSVAPYVTAKEHCDICLKNGIQVNQMRILLQRYKIAIAYKLKSVMPQNCGCGGV